MKPEDRSGQKFGKWTALSYAGKSSWNCECECGIRRVVKTGPLLSGASRGCKGCGRRRHGLADSSEYAIWKTMKRRCLKTSDPKYPRYGGRGISVCERWTNSFPLFVEDMGLRPSSDHSIDRINNDGNYEPGNCRWATRLEQSANRSTTKLIEYMGQQVSIAEAARIAGVVDEGTAASRLERGWAVPRAVETPYLRRNPIRGQSRTNGARA